MKPSELRSLLSMLVPTKEHGDAHPHNVELPSLLPDHPLPLGNSLSHASSLWWLIYTHLLTKQLTMPNLSTPLLLVAPHVVIKIMPAVGCKPFLWSHVSCIQAPSLLTRCADLWSLCPMTRYLKVTSTLSSRVDGSVPLSPFSGSPQTVTS